MRPILFCYISKILIFYKKRYDGGRKIKRKIRLAVLSLMCLRGSISVVSATHR